MSESAFVQDLALLMVVAGFVSVLFTRLGWPKVIGYILAGILLSDQTWGTSLLADESSIRTIAQLGIVFLMFTLGLEFSVSGIKKVKNVTLPTAALDTIVMVWLGYTVGRSFFHWDSVPSLFLGAAICDSSTTLLAKIIDEMKWTSRPFVKYVIGTSVCEDIACIGIISLISSVAPGKAMDFGAVGMSLGGLFLFFMATFVFGLVFVPRLLSSVAKRKDDEALLLTVLGCCFFVTFIADKLDYSLAFGAFLVGIFGASSEVRARLHRLVAPLRAMFAAVFFVSIGLLVDPVACCHWLPAILLLSAVVMVGKCINCTLGALVTGEKLKTAVQMGFGLAQIGEFAYLVAILYLSRDPASPMYQIVVGVSLLTTVMNPLMLRLSDPVGDWLTTHCPKKVISVFDAYRAMLTKLRAAHVGDPNRAIVRSTLFTLGILAALELAVAIGFSMLNGRDWSQLSQFFDAHKRYVFCVLFNVFAVSLFAPVMVLTRRLGRTLSLMIVGEPKARWQMAIDGAVRLAVLMAALGLFFAELSMLNVNLAPREPWIKWTLMGLFLVAAIAGWRFFLRAERRASERLTAALRADTTENEEAEEGLRALVIPADTLQRLKIRPNTAAIGGTVVSLNIRATTGASVVSVWRMGRQIGNPGPDFVFQAGDEIGALGSRDQIAMLKRLLEDPV